MLDYSGNTRSHNIVDKLGPYYYAFAFEGTAPTNPSEIPFDLFVNSNEIVGYPVEDFRTLNPNFIEGKGAKVEDEGEEKNG